MGTIDDPLLHFAHRLSVVVAQLARDVPKLPAPDRLRAIDAMNHAMQALQALVGCEAHKPSDAESLSSVRAEAGRRGGLARAARLANVANQLANASFATNSTPSSSSPKDSSKGTEEPTSKEKATTGKTKTPNVKDSPSFLRFWTLYPKKVGKDEARRVWQKRDLDVKLDEICLGLEKNRAFLLRDGGQFIPNPATWLNQGRWQDEPPPAPSTLSTPKTAGNLAALRAFVDEGKKS